MTLGKMPLFVWMMIVTSFLVVIAMPPFSACQIMLILDRYLDANFFDTQAGGSAVLWAHFFWIFGHPEVYILVLPAFAIASEVIPVFSRKPIFGYPVMVAATISIAFISLGVWATCSRSRTSVATFSLPFNNDHCRADGRKIFNWLGHVAEDPSASADALLYRRFFSSCCGPYRCRPSVAPFDWQFDSFRRGAFHYGSASAA
jgi:cytochrome c oxidase subunit 1